MKKYVIALLTIVLAITIIVLTGWADYIERKDFAAMAAQSLPTQTWDYFGGRWTDAAVIILSAGIIVSQICSIAKTRKSK